MIGLAPDTSRGTNSNWSVSAAPPKIMSYPPFYSGSPPQADGYYYNFAPNRFDVTEKLSPAYATLLKFPSAGYYSIQCIVKIKTIPSYRSVINNVPIYYMSYIHNTILITPNINSNNDVKVYTNTTGIMGNDTSIECTVPNTQNVYIPNTDYAVYFSVADGGVNNLYNPTWGSCCTLVGGSVYIYKIGV
jgi:hypothetical protein